MARDEEIYSAEFASNPYFMSTDGPQVVGAHQLGFKHGVEWANQHPSDETIMLILNCMGYEEESWIEDVRKGLESKKHIKKTQKMKRIRLRIDCDIDLKFWSIIPAININFHTKSFEFEWLCLGLYATRWEEQK